MLWVALIVNASMFVVELAAGHRAQSASLLADAVDFLGDAANYAVSLFALTLGAIWRSRTALLKGITMGCYGLLVLARVGWGALDSSIPHATTMGFVGLLALIANVAVAALLFAYREGDANMRSVWLCSRNDAIGNVAVMCAALAVTLTSSQWPDLAVALVMALLAMTAGRSVIKQALRELAGSETKLGEGVTKAAAHDRHLARVGVEGMSPAAVASELKRAFDSYIDQSRTHEVCGRVDAARACLEAAHVLGQRTTRLHVRAHAAMLRMAWRNSDTRELWGQIFRIVAAALITRIWIPQGNTGGSNVSAFRPMSIPDDLGELLAQHDQDHKPGEP